MTILTRADKGAPLSHTEMDENITDLRDIPTGKVFPKTSGVGIKIDTDAPTWGWHDLLAFSNIDPGAPVLPTFETYVDTITEYNFSEGASMNARWHIPHDYVPGTDLFIHVHWSHNNVLLDGGSTTWGWEITYSKGHDQGPFHASKIVSVNQAANIVPRQHLIAETQLSTSGGSATQLDTDDIETDGIILCRFYLDSNDLTFSGPGGIVTPFVHFVDIHYQSTGLPTKQRAPDFWT